jgi:hypothetical protein
MEPSTLRTVAKVSALTVALYTALFSMELVSELLSSPTRSPILEYIDIPGSPHGLVIVSWWKATVVGLLLFAYSMVVVAWVRRRYRPYPEMTTSAVVLLAAAALTTLLLWPDLSFALGDRNRVWPNPIDGSLVRFLLGFPGGALGLRVTAAALQVLVTFCIIHVMGRNRRGDVLAQNPVRSVS